MKAVLGVDVGGTSVRAGLMINNRIYEQERRPSSEVFSHPDGCAAGLCSFLTDFLGGREILAAGIGIPGTLSRDGSEVLNVPNIPGLNGLFLRDIISEAVKAPVFVENDITMLTTGDSRLLGLETGIIFGCYIGTGLGGAVLIDGKLMRGKSGLCEPGHIPIYGLDRPCGCGKIGCVEPYVAGRSLELLRERKYPDCDIAELFSRMSEAELSEYTDILAHLLAGAVQLLDPDAIIMGGGVCAMKDFPRRRLINRLRELCMKPVPSETLNLLYPNPAFSSGVFGAAVFAENNL